MITLLSLLAQTTGAPTTQGGGGPPGFLQSPFIPLLLVLGVLWFVMIRGKRREQHQRQEMLEKLRPGQRVQTIGGILGVITQANEREVTVKVDETNNVKIKFARSAVHRVVDEEKAEAK